MNNFNYNNYIGEHMVEPLRVEVSNAPADSLKFQSLIGIEENKLKIRDEENCSWWIKIGRMKPLIKSPADLTDEEWLFIFEHPYLKNKNINIHRSEIEIAICEGNYSYCNIRLSDGAFLFDGTIAIDIQQILNRLYSLHVSLDYEELIKNNKAIRKIK